MKRLHTSQANTVYMPFEGMPRLNNPYGLAKCQEWIGTNDTSELGDVEIVQVYWHDTEKWMYAVSGNPACELDAVPSLTYIRSKVGEGIRNGYSVLDIVHTLGFEPTISHVWLVSRVCQVLNNLKRSGLLDMTGYTY